MAPIPTVKGAVVGLGIDLVDIPRLGAVLKRRPGMRERIFAPEELSYTDTLVNPLPSLAGRFATKEAVMKALGVGLGAVDWTDIAVIRQEGGAPRLVVRGRAAHRADARGIATWHLSISHTDTLATATVIAVS